MKLGHITQQKIREAIRQTKGSRAPAEERLTADMLKTDTTKSAKALEKLFNKAWEEKVSEARKKGAITKCPQQRRLVSVR